MNLYQIAKFVTTMFVLIVNIFNMLLIINPKWIVMPIIMPLEGALFGTILLLWFITKQLK